MVDRLDHSWIKDKIFVAPLDVFADSI